MTEPKGREQTHLRYDLIPGFFKEQLAEIFSEGVVKYGEKNWMNQPSEFYRDCLNHAQVHLDKFNDGDHSENQLAKVAWNVLAALWYYRVGHELLGHDKPTITLNMERYVLLKESRIKAEAAENQYNSLEKARQGL